MAYRMLKQFDPGVRFVAVRDLLIAGAEIKTGGIIPRRKLTERRLRQLFNARRIEAAPGKGEHHG